MSRQTSVAQTRQRQDLSKDAKDAEARLAGFATVCVCVCMHTEAFGGPMYRFLQCFGCSFEGSEAKGFRAGFRHVAVEGIQAAARS